MDGDGQDEQGYPSEMDRDPLDPLQEVFVRDELVAQFQE